MNGSDRGIKTVLFFTVMAYYLGGYFFIAEFTKTRAVLYNVGFGFEKDIPFVPELIFGYMLIFFLLGFTYAVIEDLDFFKKVVKAFLLIITIHFAFFLVFPVECTLRPVVDPSLGTPERIVHFYYWLDLPYNCFPSMHISNCFMVMFILHRYKPSYTWFIAPLTVIVAISCIMVKQHFIVDVLAGLVVAWMVYYLVFVRSIEFLKFRSRLVSGEGAVQDPTT